MSDEIARANDDVLVEHSRAEDAGARAGAGTAIPKEEETEEDLQAKASKLKADREQKEVDEKMKKQILANVMPLIASFGTAALVAAAAAIFTKLSAINFKSSSMAGDKQMKPTDDDVSISKSETAGAEAEGKLAQDKVAGANGEVKAAETEARVQTGEVTASDGGVSALRTKAGATDIETKALKMN
jgi:hypothetical protein